MVVVQTTSASRKIAIFASNSSTRRCLASALSALPLPLAAPVAPFFPPLPGGLLLDAAPAPSLRSFSSMRFLRMVSSVMSSRCEVTFSGRPTRTTLRPMASTPSAMLSTAMLLSEVARSGFTRNSFAQMPRSCTETVVLPVPGGPCTRVSRRPKAAETAAHCEGLRSPPKPCRSLPRTMGKDLCIAIGGSSAHSFFSCNSAGLRLLACRAADGCICPKRPPAPPSPPSRDAFCFSSSISFILLAHASTLPPPTPVKGRMSQRAIRFSSLAVAILSSAISCRS
mmetsp:Transcript_66469/g.197829  ORF Transcript_66469/g.197829 Transcript_66469/m.197829 type:complete len:282 (+) Transcript_66469:272-1117(+)